MVTYITPSSLVLELIRLIWKWGALCHDSVGWGGVESVPRFIPTQNVLKTDF